MLAVSSLSTVGLFAYRVRQALVLQFGRVDALRLSTLQLFE